MSRKHVTRRGVAAIELAVLLPMLAVLLVIAVDWARIFYFAVTIENCAHNGALYASDPYTIVRSPYANITDAALADAPNLTAQPTVTSKIDVDGQGRSYVDCTVTYQFNTLTRIPLVPQTTTLTRTVRAYRAAQTAK